MLSYIGLSLANSSFPAIIFDIGGVVLRSPFIAITKYERELGLPENYLNCSMCVITLLESRLFSQGRTLTSVGSGSQGAWQKFERGEIPLSEFYESFSRELSDTTKGNLWHVEEISWGSQLTIYDRYSKYCKRKGLKVPPLQKTLNVNGREVKFFVEHGRLRNPDLKLGSSTGRYKIIALTNNFAKADVPPEEAKFLGWGDGATPSHLRALFDDFCDSSTLGMRKPEPEFYLLACERNGIQPDQAVFLDDIGMWELVFIERLRIAAKKAQLTET
ncbi:hypothetical protein C0995_001505 [Termitomyces sp. Mi166|nr:hypothetical protein C0995_001505 [Termitomyces sp. Mi166\